MTHPFAKIFYTALKKSTPGENLVLEEAEALKKKGYTASEIHEVLTKMHAGLIDETEERIVKKAADEIERYL